MGFTIKELETLSGIKAHTIRIWEQRYQVLRPSRTATNIRTYSNEELKTLLSIALLNKYGFKISRIGEMNDAERSQQILSLQFEDAKNENLVNELIGCMIDLELVRFENLLQETIRQIGINETISTIIFQFLQKIGLLWQTGRINPAHEHIVTNIIRQKIIAAIETLPVPAAGQPLFLLFLPEGEYHELGLLFVYFLLRRRSLPVIYLGANVPLRDVQYVANLKKPQYLYLHMTAAPPRFQLQKFLSALTLQNAGCRILLSGFMARDPKNEAWKQIRFLQSLPEVQSYITTV